MPVCGTLTVGSGQVERAGWGGAVGGVGKEGLGVGILKLIRWVVLSMRLV